MADYTTLRVEQRGAVVEITLNRPDLRNPFDADAHHEFVALIAALGDDRSVRAIVLAAEGPVFSAGGDFDFILAAHDDLAGFISFADEGRALIDALLELPAPVVVALHGDVYGLGTTITLACDAVVAARGVRVGDPHVAIGLVAGDGGCLFWPQAIGMLRAKRQLLTGQAVLAEDAHRMGLVTDLVAEPADALPTARAIAEQIAGLPPLAVQGTKRVLNRILQHRAREVAEMALLLELQTVASDDLVEAISAFRERRAATYHGR